MGTKLHNAAIGALFAIVVRVPKLRELRGKERSWTAFRMALGIAGAALVVLPLGLWNSWMTAIVGLGMFLTAALLPSARAHAIPEQKARELGALAVVNGGEYQPGNAPAAAVQLFAGAEHIWALDRHFQPLLVIPTGEISSVRVEHAERRWTLKVRWAEHTAEFSYHGIFAERLARVAESTMRSVSHAVVPVVPRRHAASA
jgi:hypothetical protein